jgi:hypothetical protein
MLDQVDATSEHEYAVHYHMAPGIEAVLRQETGRLTANAASATLDITYFDEQGSWQVTEGLVSPCYAAKVVAPYGIYSVRTNGPVVLLSVLFPRVPGESPPIIRNLDPKQGKSLSLTTLRFHDFVVWSERAVAEEHLHDTDFEWVWVRRTSDDYFFERIVLLHGKHVSLHEFEFTAECPLEFVSISVQDKMLSIDLSPSTGIRARPPAGIDHIVVNGGIHPLGSDEILELSQGEVPALAVARDKTGYCKYVRH